MNIILTISLLIVSTLGFGQNYNFKLLWKKGDVKKIIITQAEKEYEDDLLIYDTIIHNEAKVEVIKVNKDAYILEIILENQALRSAMKLYNKIGKELKDYKDLKLIYSVNKETAESELLNWEEAQKFMNESLVQITTILENKTPETTPFIRLFFIPIKETFKSKENIEAYMETNIGYLLTPFYQNFKIGETLSKTESQENPFNPMQKVSTTTLLTLKSVNKDSKICIINHEVKLDLSEFNEMMKSMMQKMTESFDANDSVTNEKSKEINEFEIDIKNLQVISFDYETTWVTKVVETNTIKGVEPKKGIKTKKEITTTTVVK